MLFFHGAEQSSSFGPSTLSFLLQYASNYAHCSTEVLIFVVIS